MDVLPDTLGARLLGHSKEYGGVIRLRAYARYHFGIQLDELAVGIVDADLTLEAASSDAPEGAQTRWVRVVARDNLGQVGSEAMVPPTLFC